MIIKAIILIYILVILFIDFSNVKRYYKAKLVHAITVLCLIFNHISSFTWIIAMISQNNIIEKLRVKAGIISADLNFLQSIIYIVLGIVIFLLAFAILKRSDLARKNLIRILPFLIPSNAISFYMGFKLHFAAANDYLVLFIGFFVCTGLYLAFFFLYRSEFMLSFFKEKYVK